MNISSALEIMTGTGAATFPTSSSSCMIFLMRAGGNRALNFFFLLGISTNNGLFPVFQKFPAVERKNVLYMKEKKEKTTQMRPKQMASKTADETFFFSSSKEKKKKFLDPGGRKGMGKEYLQF